MPVRIKDIAADLGLSPMAVSKALRGHSDIGAKTTARVQKRAAELNYRVDSVAMSLKTGKTHLVGLVLPDLMQSYFAEIATAIEATLRPVGYHILIAHTGENPDQERVNIELLTARKVDGLIIASAQPNASALKNLKTSIVLIDRKPKDLLANFVGASDQQVGFIATQHLIDQGCRRIAHLRGPRLSTGEGRLLGYRKALKKNGLATPTHGVVDAAYDDASGYQAARLLFKRAARPDGLVCFNDPVAVGALRAIRELGLLVPKDVAVIGVANMHYSDMLSTPLSTIDQGTTQIGQAAARRLVECMAGKQGGAVKDLLIPPTLIIRESSRLK